MSCVYAFVRMHASRTLEQPHVRHTLAVVTSIKTTTGKMPQMAGRCHAPLCDHFIGSARAALWAAGKRLLAANCFFYVFCFFSGVSFFLASNRPGNMRRDGSAQAIVRVATQRSELQIKLAISSSLGRLTPARPGLELML